MQRDDANRRTTRAGAGLVLGTLLIAFGPGALSATRTRPTTPPTRPTVTSPPATVPPETAPPTTAAPTTTTVPGIAVKFSSDAAAGTNPQSTPLCLDPVTCVLTTAGIQSRELAGDLIGTTIGSAALTLINGKLFVTGHTAVSAAIGSCGVGTFAIKITTIGPFPPPPGAPLELARWEVVPGSGTRGLTNLRGEGTFEVVTVSPGLFRTTYTGRLICSK